jgi:flavin-dependent dehydrogenase
VQGLQTLLVERRTWPRTKVCGGCLNSRAIATLRQLGLQHVLERSSAVPLGKLQLRARNRLAEIDLPGGVAVRRLEFDAALVAAASTAGAFFLPETAAVVLPIGKTGEVRQVRLSGVTGGSLIVAGRLVIAADGLGHPSLKDLPEFASDAVAGARIGLAFEIDDLPASYPAGVISMAISERGYVGVVRTANGRGNLAAAVDVTAMKSASEPASLVAEILSEAGLIAPRIAETGGWHGTIPLMRRSRRVAGHRLLIIGDAAGYTEPFTGEGMGWALRSAAEIGTLASRYLARWDANAIAVWEVDQQRHLSQVGFISRRMAQLLKRPLAVRTALGLLRAAPAVARPLVRHIYL